MKTTFWSTLTNKVEGVDVPNGILIPKIQRDYAQGRNNINVEEIRNDFLSDIKKAIDNVKLGNGEALDLDFIYGVEDIGSFVPLDGQQRLTTLFLLHWYLSFKQKTNIGEIKNFSRFKYEIRPSSNQFLKFLCEMQGEKDYQALFDSDRTFDYIIKDQNWYYSAWDSDNTIQAMIIMLDSIHRVFKNTDIVLEDLINIKHPSLTFNILKLENLGLSDSLYIRMNARGKQLTSFENLKAQVAKFIKESDFNNNHSYTLSSIGDVKGVDVETYFVTKVDTTWSDYFWKKRNDENKFDHMLLNLLTFISLNESILIDKNIFDHAISLLRENKRVSYYSLSNSNLLSEESIIKYIDILDLLCDKKSVIDKFFEESNFLKDTVEPVFIDGTNADYSKRVLFYGIFNFILQEKEGLDFSELQKWSRLLHNLTINTIYDNSSDFLSSLKGIDEFLNNYKGDLYTDFIEHKVKGFDTVQTNEELLKHRLKVTSTKWIDCIDEIEDDLFLGGQIVGLLEFSGLNRLEKVEDILKLEENTLDTYHNKLKDVYVIFKKIFNNEGLLDFENEEFRRALLTIEDYTIYSTNYCFYINGNHRDLSWKRLLKEVGNKGKTYEKASLALIELFEKLVSNKSINSQLNNIIENYIAEIEIKDWRYYFIKYPLLFQNSERHYVKFINETNLIYCLNKTKYNKYEDFDYMTLVLITKLKEKGIDISKINFEYLSRFEQFGISKIKGKSVKIFTITENDKVVFKVNIYKKDPFILEEVDDVIDFVISYF